ncbi:nucleolar complex protein 4 [[Candida] anglica]|uniref:Nucleolar complex protein 4 n=1 Tax=[Candida] anglica TaxID=148631 RepID=A0ABP0EBX3_9ASCO
MAGVKRKNSSSVTPSKKKTSSGKNALLTEKQINELAEQVSNKQYNALVELLGQYSHIKAVLLKSENDKVEAQGRLLTVVLFKCFQKLFSDNLLVVKKSYDDKKTLAIKWLVEKYDAYKTVLLEFLGTELHYDTSLQLDMLDIYLNLIKLETEHMSADKQYFPTATYKRLVESLLLSQGSDFIVLQFEETFKTCWDLQFYFFNGLSETLLEWKESKDSTTLQRVFQNFQALALTSKLLFDPETQAEQPTWSVKDGLLPSVAYKPSHFKSQFQKAIVAILSYPMLTGQYKAILLILHKRIIPYMAQPQNLMDFLTDSYNVTDDDVVPILALNSLYELMKRYNLEYPDFYSKLYSLLTSQLLYTRYRSRFFRLCDLFLTSTHLSSNLVASFIKRLARLSLRSSASGAVIVIPFVYNLMKRHPACMVMLHRPDVSANEYSDPFLADEQDPLKTGAINSSLWELETLMSHYHPNIATLAKIFGEPFRKHSYNMEDFLDWSYITLLDSEKTRRYRAPAALEFQEWDGLMAGENSYMEGWTF